MRRQAGGSSLHGVSICLFLSVCLCVCLFVCLFIYLFVCLFVCVDSLGICLGSSLPGVSIDLFVRLFCVFVCLLVCLFVCVDLLGICLVGGLVVFLHLFSQRNIIFFSSKFI